MLKLIFKGMLLYSSMLYWAFLVLVAPVVIYGSYFLIFLFFGIVATVLIRLFLTKEDIFKLLGIKVEEEV